MESELIEKRLLEVEKTAAESRALAKEAMDTAKAGLVKQTENEQRLKSIQHRVDHTEGKMDTMLDSATAFRKGLGARSKCSWALCLS